MAREYQICKRCVMDTTDPEIIFDINGFCNHCTASIKNLNNIYFIDKELKRNNLKKIIEEIKFKGKAEKYDCIIGLSGGVDSSYLAYVIVKEYGLRPLAVHLDNGWNSELAVKNIDNIVNKLKIDLYTHVINWEEFKALQLSFLRASVIDIELLTDHAIGVTLYKISKKFNIKYFLSGYNCQSENIMPSSWLYPYKMDSLNIKNIYRSNGGRLKLKTFKFLNFYEYLTFGKNKMQLIPILNYLYYNKKEAINILEKNLNWRNYGNKHEESVFTKFYQGYILPVKFNVDKRKAHLSSLICSGQIKREEALKELETPILDDVKQNLTYFLKKLDLSNDEFNIIIQNRPTEHWYYKSYAKRKHLIGKMIKLIYKK